MVTGHWSAQCSGKSKGRDRTSGSGRIWEAIDSSVLPIAEIFPAILLTVDSAFVLELPGAEVCCILKQCVPPHCAVSLEIGDQKLQSYSCLCNHFDVYNNVLLSKKSSKANIVVLHSGSDCVYLEEGAFFVQKHLSAKLGISRAVSSWEGEREGNPASSSLHRHSLG